MMPSLVFEGLYKYGQYVISNMDPIITTISPDEDTKLNKSYIFSAQFNI